MTPGENSKQPRKRPRTQKDKETVKRIHGDIPDDISDEMRARVQFLGAPPHLLPPTPPTTSWTFLPETPQRIQSIGSTATRTRVVISAGDGTEGTAGQPHIMCMFYDLGTCICEMTTPLESVSGETPVDFLVEFTESFKRSGGLNFEYHREAGELIGERGGVVKIGIPDAPLVPLPSIRGHTVVRGTVDDPEMFLQSFSSSGTTTTNSIFSIQPVDSAQHTDGRCIFEVSFECVVPASSRRLGMRLDVGDVEQLAAMKDLHFSPRVLGTIRCIANNANRPTKCVVAFARPGGGDICLFVAMALPGGTVIRCMLVEYTPRRGNIRRQKARSAMRVLGPEQPSK